MILSDKALGKTFGPAASSPPPLQQHPNTWSREFLIVYPYGLFLETNNKKNKHFTLDHLGVSNWKSHLSSLAILPLV
jgi:hypothetical protein